MTEITRVPLQPIAKGSLTKLWLGVLAAILLGAGIAWASMPAGVKVDTITEGSGPSPTASDVVFIKYVGKLADGTEFDRSRELPFPTNGIIPDGMPMQVSGVVPGFSEGLQKMQKGGKYVLHIPAEKGYGATPPQGAPIPAQRRPGVRRRAGRLHERGRCPAPLPGASTDDAGAAGRTAGRTASVARRAAIGAFQRNFTCCSCHRRGDKLAAFLQSKESA